ncbi:MAG: cysteine--tRNA ligase [Deltaproteobacteria bacterium]|nr:cysteine--tRNA ligase [Deltaproteobacteria bacterium]
MQIYNTLTRRKETFTPAEPGKVRMYVCGPTVYDAAHMGHARSAVVFDVVYRHLMSKGFQVTYVRNFTDVDDKIIRRARDLGRDYSEIAGRYIREFHEDMDALGVLRPTHEPRATEHIGDIIELIKVLVDKGNAYVAGGDVYFRVRAFPDYGKLSGRNLEDMEAGARVEVDEKKQDPFDFALWKASKPDEPKWDSPWGPGRPGWHIECSAMGRAHLGETFDIHGGGKDLIFPHHENEIAQSEAAFGRPFARFWIHNGFVNIDQEKMSKSLGNFRTVREVLAGHHPEAIRMFLLSKHYRSPVDFSADAMSEASGALERVYSCLLRIRESVDVEVPAGRDAGDFQDRFIQAMDDDFNTAGALGVVFEAVRHANRLLDQDPAAHAAELASIHALIRRAGGELGMFTLPPADFFHAAKKAAGLDPEEIERLIQKRNAARKAKDFATADAIRDQLKEQGVILEDAPGKTTWKPA